MAGQDYYCGQKESEVLIVRRLLEKSGLVSEKVSLDALHCKPMTLELMARSKGKYLVGLKDNQKELKKQIKQAIENRACLLKSCGVEKGHGRIDVRKYEFMTFWKWRKTSDGNCVKSKR